MKKGGEVYFCDPCPSNLSYGVPVVPENFSLYVGDCTNDTAGHPLETEVLAYFTDIDEVNEIELLSDAPGDVFPIQNPYAKRAHAAYPKEEYEFGKVFCERIAKCEGVEMTDAGPICPAFNNVELRKLL